MEAIPITHLEAKPLAEALCCGTLAGENAESLTARLPVLDVGFVRSVAFSLDGKTLAAGYAGDRASGGGVVLWDLAKRERQLTARLPVREGFVRSVAFSPDGKTLAAGYLSYGRASSSPSGGVVLWDTATQRRLVEEPLLVPVAGSLVESIAFSPNGKTLAAGYHGLMSGYKNAVALFEGGSLLLGSTSRPNCQPQLYQGRMAREILS